MSFLPNGSVFYNTDTKRLHAATYTDSGALDAPAKELGDFTFNLVPKTFPFSWVIQFLPGGSRFYPVQNFATSETVDRIIGKLHTHFPGLLWHFEGNTNFPTEIKEQVNIVGENKDGLQARWSAGYIAMSLMLNGEELAMRMLGYEIQGVFGAN